MKKKSFSRKVRKAFCFLNLFILLMVGNGCFTHIAESICYRCHDDIQIIERRGELSNDGKSFSIHLKMRKNYCREPFGIWKGSVEEEKTYVYPLATPEPHAEQLQFSIFSGNMRVYMKSFEVKDEKEVVYSEAKNADYNKLILPVLNKDMLMNRYSQDTKRGIGVHRDDFPFFTRPFIIDGHWDDYNYGGRLIIPYKLDGDICHVYLPRKDFTTPLQIMNKPNTSTYILGFILTPPAICLDILTGPLQFILAAPFYLGYNW